jgi:hypothetical protein
MITFDTLQGQTIRRIEGCDVGSEVVVITTDVAKYELSHVRDCCESVRLADVCGDTKDLIGYPVLLAREATMDNAIAIHDDCAQWTFYVLRTIRGSLTLRWVGESNGYYSMAVDFKVRT